jgi:hypothetical protein
MGCAEGVRGECESEWGGRGGESPRAECGA